MTKIIAVIEYLEGTRDSLQGREMPLKEHLCCAPKRCFIPAGLCVSATSGPRNFSQLLKPLHLKSGFPLSSKAFLDHTFIHTSAWSCSSLFSLLCSILFYEHTTIYIHIHYVYVDLDCFHLGCVYIL